MRLSLKIKLFLIGLKSNKHCNPKSPDFISSKYKGLRSPDNNRDKTYSPLHDSIMDAISENLQEHASESFSKVWSSSMFPERLTKEILRLVEDQINR
jgi:hypothetical protein